MSRRNKTTHASLRKPRLIFFKTYNDASFLSCQDRLAQILRNRYEMTWLSVRYLATMHTAVADTNVYSVARGNLANLGHLTGQLTVDATTSAFSL